MNPGRDLDVLVATKVMGWEGQEETSVSGQALIMDLSRTMRYLVEVPKYSTDIAAAWEVVEKTNLFQKMELFQDGNTGLWEIGYGSDGAYFSVDVEGVTAPHVICLSALKAVEK